jgi:hypothetical protein
MTVITNVSRRDLLKGAAASSGLVLGFHVGFRKLPLAEATEAPVFRPNVFLSIDETGLVTIVASRSEMGTGIKTGLPLVLADELDADWNCVKVVQALGDPKFGDQNTDGSRSTWQFFGPMRVAGATARQMLETAAAHTWNFPAGECRAQNGLVVHASSGRKLAFGDLAKGAATMPVPPSEQVRLKDRKDWRYIGKPHAIVDLKDIVRGRATYGIDVVVPRMRYASIERCPVYGGKVKSYDPQDALSVGGVEQVVEIPATPMPSGFKPLGGLLPTGRASGGAGQCAAMEPNAPFYSNASAAARRERSATRIDDRCRGTGATRGLPPTQEPGCSRWSDTGAVHGVHPCCCCREVAVPVGNDDQVTMPRLDLATMVSSASTPSPVISAAARAGSGQDGSGGGFSPSLVDALKTLRATSLRTASPMANGSATAR